MMYLIARRPSSDTLTHYGVKGMKWGVRNYQNKDGTLTELGKSRLREKRKRDKAEAADDGKSKTLSIRHKVVKDLPTSDPELVRQGEYWYNQHGEMLADIRYEVGCHPHNDKYRMPNAVVEYHDPGHDDDINRVLWDNRAVIAEEINSGSHGNPKLQKDFPPDGAHMHKHDENGVRMENKDRKGKKNKPDYHFPLTDEERKEHHDALKR